MTEPSPTATWLAGLHAPLGEALATVQYRLMDRRADQARAALSVLKVALAAHITAEEAVLLPAYEQAVPQPGRGAAASVFLAEHIKLKAMIEPINEALSAAGEGEITHPQALALLEAVHPLKALMHHHERREERLLAPALDDALGLQAQALWGEMDAALRSATG